MICFGLLKASFNNDRNRKETSYMKDLIKDVVMVSAKKWKDLGKLLDINAENLNLIEKECQNYFICCYIMLKGWLKDNTNRSWAEILNAVARISDIESSEADEIHKSRILEAVSTFYKKTFNRRWKDKVNIIAALILENEKDDKNRLQIVVFTVGTKYKSEFCCSYKKDQPWQSWHTWDFCDGHAEALCYKLSTVYMLTEIYKIDNTKEYSIFQTSPDHKGYELKEGIKFHLLISYHPCGFMQKKMDGILSWKYFAGRPHIFECSSKILIGAYLGIQGPLSCMLTKPVYISSVVILYEKNKGKTFLDTSTIEKSFKDFNEALNVASSTHHNNFQALNVMSPAHNNNMKLSLQSPHVQEQTLSFHCKVEAYTSAIKTFNAKVCAFEQKILAVYQQLLDVKCRLVYHIECPKIIVKGLQNIKEVFPGICSPDDAYQAKVGFLLHDIFAEDKFLFGKFSFDAHNKNVENIAIKIDKHIYELELNIRNPSFQVKQFRFDLLMVAMSRFTQPLIKAKDAQKARIEKHLDNKNKDHNKHLETWRNITAKLGKKEIVPKEEVNSALNNLNNCSKDIKHGENMQRGLCKLDVIKLSDLDCDWSRYIDEMKNDLYLHSNPL